MLSGLRPYHYFSVFDTQAFTPLFPPQQFQRHLLELRKWTQSFFIRPRGNSRFRHELARMKAPITRQPGRALWDERD
jgi:hypothetical protein